MNSRASAPASGWTIASSEPPTNTQACNTANRSGLTFSSAGMSGKTAAPSGTSPLSGSGASSATSASGHGGDDAQLVAVLDRGAEVVEVTHVLVVEVDVQEALELGAVEHALGDVGVLLAQLVEGRLHGAGGHLDDGVTGGVR